MGRLILKLNNNKLESLKCKSEQRAKEIVRKRLDVKEWNFYEDNERIPQQRKKVVQQVPLSFEELEVIMKQQGIIQG